MLAGVGNLLTIQGISANPPGTANGDSDTVSNLRRDTQLRSRRAPRVCALLTLCCSRAVCVCVCVCARARDGVTGVKQPDLPPPSALITGSAAHVSASPPSASHFSPSSRSAVSPRLWTSGYFCVSAQVSCTLAGSCAALLRWGRTETGRRGSGHARRDRLCP